MGKMHATVKRLKKLAAGLSLRTRERERELQKRDTNERDSTRETLMRQT